MTSKKDLLLNSLLGEHSHVMSRYRGGGAAGGIPTFVTFVIVCHVHLKELNLLLVGETSCLGVVLRERIAFDWPNN